jgi:hypothetical protein
VILVTSPAVVPLHLGSLHPYEQGLVALIALGPFVVLFIVVFVLRRRDAAQEEPPPQPPTAPDVIGGVSGTLR